MGGEHVHIHPGSINARPAEPSDGYYVYGERAKTSQVFLRDTTRVSPYALLLFGAPPEEVSVEQVKRTGRVVLADGVELRCTVEAALLLKTLRRELDAMLLEAASGGTNACFASATRPAERCRRASRPIQAHARSLRLRSPARLRPR